MRIAKIIENFMWEEPCISGDKGALAIFFSGCNLRCKFCQNYEISHIGKGEEYSPQEFRALLEKFDLTKFSSIDLITPTHFSSQICAALDGFKSPIPVVWNSSGYESADTIKKVSQICDVFLVDFKYVSSALSQQLSSCPDYFAVAKEVVPLMARLKPQIFDGNCLRQGVLIRHLILPGHIDDSRKCLDFIKENIPNPFISIMSQFTPTPQSPITRRLEPLEVKAVLSYAQKLGLTNGYFQDLDSSSDAFIPKF